MLQDTRLLARGDAPFATTGWRICTLAEYTIGGQIYSLDLGCDLIVNPGSSSSYVVPRAVNHDPDLDGAMTDCATGNVADGYAGNIYARAATESVSNGSKVCVRLTDGSVGVGGRFLVSGTASAPAFVDTNSAACATAGNVLPGPHPLLHGSIGSPSNPTTYAAYDGDAYSNGSQVWVCFSVTSPAGSFGYRAAFTGSLGVPSVAFVPDTGTATGPAAINSGTESGKCATAVPGYQRADFANLDTMAGHVWLSERSTPAATELCVRVQGGVTAGGRLAVANPAGPVSVTGNTSACTQPVITQTAPVHVEVKTGAASVCVITDVQSYAVTTGPVTVPSATWNPDAG